MPHEETEPDKLQELIKCALKWEAKIPVRRASVLAAHFATLEEFLTVTAEQMGEIRSVTGRLMVLLTDEQIEAIKKLQASDIISSTREISENLLTLITRDFVRKQVKMLDELALDRLSPNPFLIKCLNLKTPREVVELNVYMFATRSIVTSMGFFVEKLLLASSESASLCNKPWDLLKTDRQAKKHWIQVKSGPNDMDADQIRHWSHLIAEKLGEGDQAYIGITYGKRSTPSVTIGLFRTYLPDWEKRTLIGRELWDFISEDSTYHQRLFPLLAEAASQVLGSDSIEDRIQSCVERITSEFLNKYGTSIDGVERYLADIF